MAHGDATMQILHVAERKQVGMIAMNAHGRTGFMRFFLGGVSEEVLHGANAPVYLTCNRKPVKLVLAEPRAAEEPANV